MYTEPHAGLQGYDSDLGVHVSTVILKREEMEAMVSRQP